MEQIKVKTILTKVKYGDEWYGIDYNMNLYQGCSHGCIYCDSRSECYHIDDFGRVRGKQNALQILEQELSKKRKEGVVGIGAMSDTYNPMERQFEQTRGALKLLAKYKFGVSVDTKSTLILRDIDLLKEVNIHNNAIVKFTITTPRDELCRKIEPCASLSSERFAAIEKLTENGIFTGIMMTPVLPFITDNEADVKHLVKMASESGAKFISTYMGMTLRDIQRQYYYEKLDEQFPAIRKKYMEYYGERYSCAVPNSKKLYSIFVEECEKFGILYKMKDIIGAYKQPKGDKQLSLFD